MYPVTELALKTGFGAKVNYLCLQVNRPKSCLVDIGLLTTFVPLILNETKMVSGISTSSVVHLGCVFYVMMDLGTE